ncbi:toprim domain-containing protein [Candidatus Poriferisodalis multihospitum]|uniref:toprim domain-containing protein n=1 Tax=Candidatus Poriferisodalis multihospitum TaxID=2983191 RepID=UPI003A4E2BFA
MEQLAAAANITLTYDAPGAQRTNQRRKELLDLLEKAARFYHERLMDGADAGPARAYLRRRGYDRDTVVKWRLGYAPPRWDDLCRHLGAPPEQMAAAGLAYAEAGRARAASRRAQERPGSDGGAASGAAASDELGNSAGHDPDDDPSDESADDNAADSASDFFRDRIMFPICDASGRVVSFAGRLLPRPDEPAPKGPKYKNTVGTAVYDKSKVLYGLNFARQAARTAERIVVCEGYTDVIGCDLAGVSEAVATCGTALTQQHAELLSRSAKRVVLAFDADAAGQTATERVHQWEREFGLDIFVATLPPGADPGDLAQTNPPALRRALDEAQPLHTFRAERILGRADLKSPAGRDRAADEAAEVFAIYPPEILLDSDLEPVAGRIPMDIGNFRGRVDAVRRRLDARPVPAVPDPYLDAPPPPEPDDGYFESLDRSDPGGAFYGLPPDGPSSAAPPTGRDSQRQRDSDVELLAAALAPEGDAAELLVSALFATEVGEQAFERLNADPDWCDAQVGDQLAGSAPAEPETPEDAVVAVLATAALEGATLSAASAIERAAMAHWRFVRATRLSVGSDVKDPHVKLDPSAPNCEQILRWLRDREPELLDATTCVGAALAVADWLRSRDEADSIVTASERGVLRGWGSNPRQTD